MPSFLRTTLTLVGITAFLSIQTTAVNAWQVQVSPAKPELGDTISIEIKVNPQTDEQIVINPTVNFNHSSYPSFPIASNQFRAFLPTTALDQPGSKQIQIEAAGKVQNLVIFLHDRTFPLQHITLSPQKAALEATPFETKRLENFKQLDTPQKFWSGPFLRPNYGTITTVYGVRRYYNNKFDKTYFHRGVDYAGSYGSPVIAPAAGRVALVGEGFKLEGNCIGIDHGQGVTSLFMHLSHINVKEGDFVKAGQVIGTLGATGEATGPNLHWGLYVHGKAVDPEPWRKVKFN